MVAEWSEISKIKFSWNKVEDVTQKGLIKRKKLKPLSCGEK